MLLLVIKWILIIVKVSECITDTCGGNDTARVANMCQSTDAIEEDNDESDKFNSVFLSLMNQESNCSCNMSIENAINPNIFINLYIKRLNNFTGQPLCGMEIDIYQQGPKDNDLVQQIPTRCNSTKDTIQLSLRSYENLQFISRVVKENFLSGYCIQIIREHKQGHEDTFLKISCDAHALTATTDTTIHAQTTFSDMITHPQTSLSDTITQTQTTLHDFKILEQTTPLMSSATPMIDKSHLNDKANSDGDTTLYIAIGAGGGFVLFVSLLVVIVFCKRRKSHHSVKEENSGNHRASSAVDDDDDDGLKYNVLYVSSERQDDIDVNYSTADGDIPRHLGGDDEGDYSTVDDNKNIQDSSLNTNQATSTALEVKEDDEHTNAQTESGCVYAVVNKSHKTKSSVTNIETASTSAIYAVVDKNRVKHPDEGNNDKTR